MKKLHILSVFTGLVFISACSSDPSGETVKTDIQAADMILHNGNIYTFSWNDPGIDGTPDVSAPFIDGAWTADAQAIALLDGKIMATGSNEDILKFADSETSVFDIEGATVLPGFVESHGHYSELGEIAERIDLAGVTTMEEMARRVEARIANTPPGVWVMGAGWDEGAWADNLPTRDAIDRVSPENPVVLKGRRGFGTLVNSLALTEAGINSDMDTPSGGDIVTDENGQLTGVLLNRAQTIVTDAMPPATLEQKKRIVKKGLQDIADEGYVSGHHAGIYADYYPAYMALAENNELPVRVEAMIAARPENVELMQSWIERGPQTDPAAMLQVRAVKAYYDASLGSRGARLLEDYSDMPGHRGVSGADYGFPEELVTAAVDAGFQVGTHAIGDAGNREVLDFYETLAENNPQSKNLLHRVEHAQVIHPYDFARFGQLNIVASMQPCHAVEDSPWAEDRVGADRIRGAYAWRSLRENGALLIFNSDLSGTDFDIFYGLHCSVTRSNRAGEPAGGWYPEQSLRIEEAVRAWTVWPARASQREDITGSIEPGKLADLTIISNDIMHLGETNPAGILQGSVKATIVAGKIVAGQL